RRQGSGGELDDEGGRLRGAVVLPGDDASRLARQAREPEPREACEAALDGDVAARLVDDVEVLVEPDRHLRVEPRDQAPGDPALGLRERVRAGVVDAAERAPAAGEVAVQVDAVGVAAR